MTPMELDEIDEIERNLDKGDIEGWQDIRPHHVRALINEVRRLRQVGSTVVTIDDISDWVAPDPFR